MRMHWYAFARVLCISTLYVQMQRARALIQMHKFHTASSILITSAGVQIPNNTCRQGCRGCVSSTDQKYNVLGR